MARGTRHTGVRFPSMIPESASRPATFNPMAGNPLKTRRDVVEAIRDLYLPLTPFYSPGCARVRLDMAGTHFDRAASDLEGFSRPLWGLAPLAAGGGADFVDWEIFRRGLANGTNPDHPEFWGQPATCDQRLVELAAVGFALALIPEILWQPQSNEDKKNIAGYLQQAYAQHFVENNWMFFRVMIGLGLKAAGEKIDHVLMDQYLLALDDLYLGEGWYCDGRARRADHYIAFAMHFCGLIFSRLGGDSQRTKVFRQRAQAFSADFIRWFSADGAVVPFGRSMTYRFACGGFWAALAFADFPALPWGQIKGLVLRHLRWWSRQPIAHRDGVLSIGYAYPNLHMCEPYNSAGSPYWAFKIFAFLALPQDHPFWTAEEETLPANAGPATQAHPGMVIFNPPGDVIALAGGQEEQQKWLRMAPEKYCKFAYSARYGFSVETDARQFDAASLDNMLAFSEDGRHFRVREGNREVRIAESLIYAKWSPDGDTSVETWLLPATPWHIRIHRIQASRPCQIIEGGFAVPRPDGGPGGPVEEVIGMGSVFTATDMSGVRDLGSTVKRTGRVLDALPNSNLIASRTTVPQLVGQIPAGESVLITAVLAMAGPAKGRLAWVIPPPVPVLEELESIIQTSGREVTIMLARPRSRQSTPIHTT